MKRERAGFTLVELLVVVTIIGMLVGLLVPAVISARERARQGVCINRLKELATATLHYESARGQFPGWRNPAPLADGTNVRQLSWVIALFPYLGRENLWQDWRDTKVSMTPVFLEQVVCPSDAGNNSPGALNYVANGYLFRDRQTPSPANTIVLERLRSAQQTVMISERVNSSTYPVGFWSANQDTDESRLTFNWLVAGVDSSVSSLASNAWGISSNHGGLVHVAFADGHVEALTQETPTADYLCQPPP